MNSFADIPAGWAVTSLDRLIERISGGGTPSKSNPENFSGSIPFMTVKDMKGRFVSDTVDHISEKALNSSVTTLVPADTLVVATRMSLGKIIRPSMDVAINQDLKALFLKDGVDKTYIEHFWRYSASVIQEMGTGTTVKGIRLEDIRSLPVPVPPSEEQRRIAEKLDRVLARVDAANEHLSRVGSLLKRFRQAVLDAAVSGKLTNGWRSKNDGREWGWCRLADVANVGTGSTPLKNNSNYYSSRGVPWITSSATGFDFIEASRDYVTELALRECRLKIYPPGTLVVAMYGEGKTRGQVSELVFSAAINQACAAVEVVSDLIDIKFLKVFFQANYGKMRLMAEGGSQPNLNLSKIKNLSVPLPSIEEQKEIVRRVSEVMTYSQGIGGRLAAIRSIIGELTPVLLAKAFRGGLVEQNPLDEPASELLARLAEAKATESQNTTRRKRQASA